MLSGTFYVASLQACVEVRGRDPRHVYHRLSLLLDTPFCCLWPHNLWKRKVRRRIRVFVVDCWNPEINTAFNTNPSFSWGGGSSPPPEFITLSFRWAVHIPYRRIYLSLTLRGFCAFRVENIAKFRGKSIFSFRSFNRIENSKSSGKIFSTCFSLH